ncbi:uncharacterized protein [Rutidosis leptorrhynchoides]|uniref:uncharacterized protein n=1 Tax=Rutidosis leptorrhynchoides TaxID=125765 RepID=UPI003A993627
MGLNTESTGSVQYEDFRPNSEYKEESDANILFVHLPGFQKEQIKVTYVHATRTVNVHAEQAIVGTGKWRRCNEAFPVPQNCKVLEIRGKFQSGILTITMPKEIVTQVVSPPFPKEPAKLIPPPQQQAAFPPKEDMRLPSRQKDEKTEPKAQLVQEIASPKANPSFPNKPTNPLSSPGEKEKFKSENSTIPKVTSPASKFNQFEETAEKLRASEVSAFEKAKTEGKPKFDQEKINYKPEEGNLGRRDTKKAETSSDAYRARIDKDGGSEIKQKRVDKEEEEKKMKGKSIVSMVDAAKKAIQDFALDMNEEKKAMVNMGVAVLVLAAFGAYLAFSFGSSSNGKAKE